MGWPAEELVLPNNLSDLILSGRCLAFIGSGPAIGIYGNWSALVNMLCEKCGSQQRLTKDNPPEDYLTAAEDARQCNSTLYHQALGQHFGRVDLASSLDDSLLQLPFGSYLTTRFDPLFARAASHHAKGCRLPPMAYPNLDRAHIYGRSIYHVHGYIGENAVPLPGSIVLAQSEFDEAYKDDSALMHFLIPTLENDPVCFVGCSLREPTLRRVFEVCASHQATRQNLASSMLEPKSIPPKRYIILERPQVMSDGEFSLDKSQEAIEAEDGYYAELGIEVVRYNAVNNDHSTLRRAFERLIEQPSLRPNFGWGGSINGG